jgi:teichuronic acid biosynthesis glycosyltransferase TuaC
MIRLLSFTTLFPNQAAPNHGVFVENRLRHLVASGEACSTVLAPVPFHTRVPGEEMRHGLRVLHPRFPMVPGLGLWTSPMGLFWSARRTLERMFADGFDFDVLDAHYLHPEGIVAVRLGQHFGKPVVLTARGSDVSLLPRYPGPRRAIRRAMREADALIAVSAGLKDAMVELGADAAKITVLRNGVDLDLFHPAETRAPHPPTLLSVGLLIPRKGHDRIIAALPELPGFHLRILGEGPERGRLEAQARALGVGDRVAMPGAVPHAALAAQYGAADALVLASSREGWANVLLEAMACGTPVLASPAWGCREAVQAPEAGRLLADFSVGAIVAGVRALFAALPDRAETRRYAEGFGWAETTAGQLAVFRRVLGGPC